MHPWERSRLGYLHSRATFARRVANDLLATGDIARGMNVAATAFGSAVDAATMLPVGPQQDSMIREVLASGDVQANAARLWLKVQPASR